MTKLNATRRSPPNIALMPGNTADRVRWRHVTRTQNRFACMRHDEAAKVTDAFECCVEDRFRGYLLALPAGTRIPEGWRHICDWITATFAIPFSDLNSLHSHLIVLLMSVVGILCEGGFLEPKYPSEPEFEFIRTNKAAPVSEPWE
jgi:hypothetical protein